MVELENVIEIIKTTAQHRHLVISDMAVKNLARFAVMNYGEDKEKLINYLDEELKKYG